MKWSVPRQINVGCRSVSFRRIFDAEATKTGENDITKSS